MPYLNSVVFYRDLDRTGIALISLPPRAMAAAVEAGSLDAGPLPLAEVLRLGARLRPIGDYCIATNGRVDSVLLLSRVPVESLSEAEVAVTSHTATSIQLLRVLFASHWQVTPARYVDIGAPHSAKLVIGDEALKLRHPSTDYPHIYDLSYEWQRLTGLPFVFATWSARIETDARAIDALALNLGRSVELGLSRLQEFAAEYATEYFTTTDVVKYIRGFTYRVGNAEQQAISEFQSRLNSLPAWRPETATPAKGA